MGALTVLDRGVLASDFLSDYTDKRPNLSTTSYKYEIDGITIPVTHGITLRVNEKQLETLYVEPGQSVHFFQDPADDYISRGTIVFAVYQGKASVAVYRKGVGIKQKH